MPVPLIQSFAKRYGVPAGRVEAFWQSAKKEYGQDYAAVTGTVKKMCQNYGKKRAKALKG